MKFSVSSHNQNWRQDSRNDGLGLVGLHWAGRECWAGMNGAETGAGFLFSENKKLEEMVGQKFNSISISPPPMSLSLTNTHSILCYLCLTNNAK